MLSTNISPVWGKTPAWQLSIPINSGWMLEDVSLSVGWKITEISWKSIPRAV